MFNDFSDLIRANNRAISALIQILARLNELTIGALPQDNSFLQAQISQTNSQINLLSIINAHLEAASVPFQPLDQETETRLLEAFRRVDMAIVQNEILGAGIDTINDIFAAATRIGGITNNAA